jgi:hypothetical protein
MGMALLAAETSRGNGSVYIGDEARPAPEQPSAGLFSRFPDGLACEAKTLGDLGVCVVLGQFKQNSVGLASERILFSANRIESREQWLWLSFPSRGQLLVALRGPMAML